MLDRGPLVSAILSSGDLAAIEQRLAAAPINADVERLIAHIKATRDNVPPSEGGLVLARWARGDR